MPWSPTLTELRDLLADLYPTAQDARRVVEEAGLPPARIAFESTAVNTWHSILREAGKRQMVQTIIDVAQRDYPQVVPLSVPLALPPATQQGSSSSINAMPPIDSIVLNQLVDAAQHGLLTLFVGADLPAAITGLPAGGELAQQLAGHFGATTQANATLSAVAQAIGRKGDVLRYLLDPQRLDTTGKQPQPFDHFVAQLQPVKLIVSTRYDDLIERAFQAINRPLDVLVNEYSLRLDENRPALIKLYGDLRQPTTITLSSADVFQLALTKQSLMGRVKTALTGSTALFLGYDLTSPDFQALWQSVLLQLAGFTPRAYAVREAPFAPQEREMWINQGIELVHANPLAIVQALAERVTLWMPEALVASQGARSETGPSEQSPNSMDKSQPQPGEETVSSSNQPNLTPGQRRRLQDQYDEWLRKYETARRRIAALDSDIGRELDSQRKQILQERRADLAAERDQASDEMASIEQQLESEPATSLEPARPAAGPDSSDSASPLPEPAPTKATPDAPELPVKAYRNFDLEIEQEDGKIVVRVLRSPEGEGEAAAATFGAPPTLQDLDQLGDLDTQIGQRLLPDAVGERWAANVATAERASEGLRLRLYIRDETLQGIPWEVSTVRGKQLALRPQTPLVRYVPAGRAPDRLAVDGPLRMLVLLSDSKALGLVELDTQAERAELAAALAPLEEAGKLSLEWLEGVVSRRQLLDTLRRVQPHLLHYMGHGDYNESSHQGVIFLGRTSASGKIKADMMTMTELALSLEGTPVRLALLNACKTGRAAGGVAEDLVRAVLPAAVGVQASVPDAAAAAFAGAFYRAIADGWPVDAAMADARRLVALEFGLARPWWGLPVLYMRSEDGRLFA